MIKFQSLGRAQCLCHPRLIGCTEVTFNWFQSLGRAQCLCHLSNLFPLIFIIRVSIARSRSMPLPRGGFLSARLRAKRFNRSVALNASATDQPGQHVPGHNQEFQSLGRAQCLCHPLSIQVRCRALLLGIVSRGCRLRPL